MFDPSEFSSGAGKVMACVDGNADLMMIYKGKGFTFSLYTLLDDMSTGRTYKLKDTLDLQKELNRVREGEGSKMDEFDLIVDMRILSDNRTLRLTQMRKKVPYQIDWNIMNYQPEVRKLDAHRFEDRSLFRYGLTYVANHESLNRFIAKQLSSGNMISFPEKDF
jgi:hypothetical protein